MLAAGLGARLGDGAGDIPKPMMPVGGKPLMEHAIAHLRAHAITELYINLHYRPSMIRDYFGDGRRWGVRIRYSHEPELLGTAGAVKNLEREFDGTFLVYYADNLCSCDLSKMLCSHKEKGSLATILVSGSYDRVRGGVVRCDRDGRVTRFEEKPASAGGRNRLENGGIYILEPRIMNYIPDIGPSDFAADIFPLLLQKREALYCYKAEGYVRGIDTPQRYHKLQEEIQKGTISPGANANAKK